MKKLYKAIFALVLGLLLVGGTGTMAIAQQTKQFDPISVLKSWVQTRAVDLQMAAEAANLLKPDGSKLSVRETLNLYGVEKRLFLVEKILEAEKDFKERERKEKGTITELLTDVRIQVIGTVQLTENATKATASWYTLKGFDGGMVDIRYSNQIVPIVNYYVYLLGAIAFDHTNHLYVDESIRYDIVEVNHPSYRAGYPTIQQLRDWANESDYEYALSNCFRLILVVGDDGERLGPISNAEWTDNHKRNTASEIENLLNAHKLKCEFCGTALVKGAPCPNAANHAKCEICGTVLGKDRSCPNVASHARCEICGAELSKERSCSNVANHAKCGICGTELRKDRSCPNVASHAKCEICGTELSKDRFCSNVANHATCGICGTELRRDRSCPNVASHAKCEICEFELRKDGTCPNQAIHAKCPTCGVELPANGICPDAWSWSHKWQGYTTVGVGVLAVLAILTALVKRGGVITDSGKPINNGTDSGSGKSNGGGTRKESSSDVDPKKTQIYPPNKDTPLPSSATRNMAMYGLRFVKGGTVNVGAIQYLAKKTRLGRERSNYDGYFITLPMLDRPELATFCSRNAVDIEKIDGDLFHVTVANDSGNEVQVDGKTITKQGEYLPAKNHSIIKLTPDWELELLKNDELDKYVKNG